MNRIRNSRSGLLLIELILAILFFSLGSAVCIRVFAQARLTGAKARDVSFASTQVSAAASFLRCAKDGETDAKEYFPGARWTGDGLQAFYDRSRQPCAREEAAYTLTAREETFGIRRVCTITMTGEDGVTLYELTLRCPADQDPDDSALSDRQEVDS